MTVTVEELRRGPRRALGPPGEAATRGRATRSRRSPTRSRRRARTRPFAASWCAAPASTSRPATTCSSALEADDASVDGRRSPPSSASRAWPWPAPVPVLAAIDGVCIGGALEFAASCDLRIATDRARFATPEVGIGLVATNAGTLLLPEVLGETAARELLLGGELHDADWALAAASSASSSRPERSTPAWPSAPQPSSAPPGRRSRAPRRCSTRASASSSARPWSARSARASSCSPGPTLRRPCRPSPGGRASRVTILPRGARGAVHRPRHPIPLGVGERHQRARAANDRRARDSRPPRAHRGALGFAGARARGTPRRADRRPVLRRRLAAGARRRRSATRRCPGAPARPCRST